MQVSLSLKNALIVEDKTIIALDLKYTFKKWGFENSVIFDSGEKAIEYLEDYSPTLAILDIRLADNVSGIEVAKKLKQKKIPFIFLSAFSDPVNLKSAEELNPFAIIKKPLLSDQISEVLERFLETDNGFDSEYQ
jgi:two-component system, response regulator PdtaR